MVVVVIITVSIVIVMEVVVVVLVIVEVVVAVVVKDLAGTGGVIGTLVRMVNEVAIILGFGVSASRSVDALSGGAVDLLMDALAGVLIVVLIGGLAGNIFVGVISVKFFVPVPLEVFSC